jgi:DedD protein
MKPVMDRALKERIIGAAVLVGFAVLVVPVFLDGPSSDAEIISESVTLPGQNEQERKSQTIVLERDRTEPVPAAAKTGDDNSRPLTAGDSDKQAVVAKTLATAPAKNPPKPAGQSKPVPDESPTGMWAVQLGSFSNQKNADRLAADLRKQGYAAFLSQLQTESGALHRVRIGPQKSRESAEAVAAKLNSADLNGQVVPHP